MWGGEVSVLVLFGVLNIHADPPTIPRTGLNVNGGTELVIIFFVKQHFPVPKRQPNLFFLKPMSFQAEHFEAEAQYCLDKCHKLSE